MRPRVRTSILSAVSLALALTVSGGPAMGAGTPQRDPEAERLGLRLLNCTRTGGWVRADGTCKGRGSGTYSAYVRPLRLHDGISSKVAFSWASELVTADVCDHVLPGRPVLAMRLASAGFHDQTYGENVGCSWGGMATSDMVIAAHRAMQAEKASGGGHWRNMKERGFRSVGIGVAALDGRTTIVFDFYGL